MADFFGLSDLKSYLEITTDDFDTRLEFLASQVSNFIRSETNRSFTNELRTERVDGGGDALEVTNYPIVSVDHIRDTFEDDPTDVDTDSYDAVNKTGLIYRRGSKRIVETEPGQGTWGSGESRWEVKYTGGFGETAADIPDDLVLAALQLAAQLFEQPDTTISSETLGDRRIQRELSDGMSPMVKATVDRYRSGGGY